MAKQQSRYDLQFPNPKITTNSVQCIITNAKNTVCISTIARECVVYARTSDSVLAPAVGQPVRRVCTRCHRGIPVFLHTPDTRALPSRSARLCTATHSAAASHCDNCRNMVWPLQQPGTTGVPRREAMGVQTPPWNLQKFVVLCLQNMCSKPCCYIH